MSNYYEIDVEALRKGLINHFEEMAYCGMPAYFVDAAQAERATPDELLRMAERERIDLSKFIVQ